MAGAALDIVLEKHEKGPLNRFKNQSLILKKFGEEGLGVYNAIDGKKTAADILKETGVEEEKFVEILEFLEKNGIVTITTIGVEKPKEAEKPKKPKMPPKKPPKKAPPEAPEEELVIKPIPEMPERPPVEEAPPVEEEAPEKPPVEEEKPPVEEKAPPVEKKVPEKPPVEEVPPVEEEIPERPPVEEAPPVEEEAPPPIEKEVPPIEEEVPEKPPVEEVEKPPVKKEKKKAPTALSPFEKIIHGKYGDMGVRIYGLIDGEKTAEEILVETGISEVKLVEILEFMDTQGIIRLEKPEEEEVKRPPPPEKVTKFEPITEERLAVGKEEAPRMEIAGELVEVVPIDVPMRVDLNLMQKIQLTPLLALKFKDKGLKVYDAIDGMKNMIDLSIETDTPLNELDLIFGYLGERNMLLFKTLTRDDVEDRYGSSGFAVYKKYGRDGILLYEMIGKEESLKDIIVRSEMSPKRAIDMFLFIHKVLGVDIPLDKKRLYAQLGLREE